MKMDILGLVTKYVVNFTHTLIGGVIMTEQELVNLIKPSLCNDLRSILQSAESAESLKNLYDIQASIEADAMGLNVLVKLEAYLKVQEAILRNQPSKEEP